MTKPPMTGADYPEMRSATRRQVMRAAAFAGALAATSARAASGGSASAPSDRALRLMRDSLVWDNHSCMPLRPGDTSFLDQLGRHASVGTDVVILNVGFDATPWQDAFKMLATFRSWLKARPNRFLLVETAADIDRARREGKLGIAFNLEGGAAVDDTPDLLEPFHALGVRWMLIAYNRNNRLGGGGQDTDSGLTEFGRRVIRRMEALGILLCCSHTGYRTAREAMEFAEKPVIFSHSNALALRNHPRNIPDDLMMACARTGGVVNINGIGEFLGRNDNSTETIVRHIRYIADRVGPDHVGLGLDYVFDSQELDAYIRNNPQLFPAEAGYTGGVRMVEPERIPLIVDQLLAAGWSDNQVKGLLGANNYRLAAAIWRGS
jgi:membrane dipeptidase